MDVSQKTEQSMVSEARLLSRRRRSILSRLSIFLLQVTLLAGCVMSPIPQPPNLDTGRMSALTCSDCPEPGGVIFKGEPNAVSGENAYLWVLDLDRALPSQLFDIEADGSFEILVVGDIGDTFRFRVLLPSTWSEPSDVTVDADSGGVFPAPEYTGGGDCEYVDLPGTCTVTNLDFFPETHNSFASDDPAAPFPNWFDPAEDIVGVTVDDPISVDDSFSCHCQFIISGVCSPTMCEAL